MSLPLRARSDRRGPSPLAWAALLAALVAIAPLAAAVMTALQPGAHSLTAPTFLRYAGASAALAAMVAVGATVLGAAAGVLVGLHRFPGRGLMAWLLAAPLAAPTFVLAYGYADLFDVAGPIQSSLRGALGVSPDLNVRSLWGAGLILSLAFYPYVYLTVRAALAHQSASTLEAARTLGATRAQTLRRIILPLLRPALAAGAALAVMETLADYGAVSFLGVQTLTTGVVRAWSVFGSTAEAARLALPLVGAAAVLLWIERRSRQGRVSDAARAKATPLALEPLGGWRGLAALVFCVGLIGLGLALPLGWLAHQGLSVEPDTAALVRAGRNVLILAVLGGALTLGLATALALGGRRTPFLTRLAGLGYATPGAVMAVGLLAPAGFLWRGVEGAAQGLGAGVLLLVLAYASRLTAAALEPIGAGLERVTPAMAHAARSLGESETGAALRVELPMARGALLTAALLVFIDILKELPATVMLRPFGFDTLAVIADRYAKDERLAQAAWPSLLIVLIAAPVVIWLNRQVSRTARGVTQ
ncbi:iron ABC transporter permease [Brevundimonas sp. 2R-24]|uniref:Iron ABC transporter permease n=1 Tax=Peiella sedimenti TaxID=3061083 RepID=A0ABT8SPL0_9CAUL|nr:iron ABC transporter permease [Caulobacteraceae bacterium XZ-24]